MVTLLGAGVLGSGPQPADGVEPLSPTGDLAAETIDGRDTVAASRSFERAPLVAVAMTEPDPTPAPGLPVEAEVEEEAAPEPEPEPETVPDVTGEQWTTAAVNVRTAPSADAEKITTVAFATPVDITGTTEDGWSQIVWDGAAAWISSSYLADSKPEPEPEPAAPAATSSSSSSSSTGTSGAACSVSSGIESGLQSNAIAVYRSVCAAFPQVSSYGGLRPGDSGDHGTGRAVDIMISGETGWEIARYLQANAGSLGITYIIYEQRIWRAGKPTSAWEWMEDRGSVTANHYDHVHVSTS